MVRGRGGYPRGNYRGNSWKGAGGYGRQSPDRFNFGGKYGSDMYRMDDYPKSYRMDDFINDRQSPERKRVRMGSRHDSYGGGYNSGRYEPYPPERRGFSGERERHMATSSPYSPRREDFRKPPSTRDTFRGRLGNRGSRSGRRDRGVLSRRRLSDSYGIRKKGMRAAERRAKIQKLRSYSGSRRKHTAEGGDQVESEEDDIPEKKEEEEAKPKVEKMEDDEEDAPPKETVDSAEPEEAKEGDEKEEEGEEKPKEKPEESSKVSSKKFFKLECPRCNVVLSSFRHYDAHLRGRTHKLEMSKVALKRRVILSQMRQAQRNAQNELEKNTSNEELTYRTHLCQLCKLNYRQSKAVHQNSQAHKNMKKYLMPRCKVCKLFCRSPMFYENHLCSIDHLKRKQRAIANNEESLEEDNLEDFTTIDSVGDVEENVPSGDEEKGEIDVGVELIKKVEVYYCELCRMYLRRGRSDEQKRSDEDTSILSSHCKKRSHMQHYVTHKENEALRQRAEKLQRKETAEKGKKKEEAKKEDQSMDTSDAKQTSKTDEDKLWDSVDKDLGELLEEGDGNKSDYDDDDSRVNGERYDRFKSDEGKSGEEVKSEAADKDKAADQPEKKVESTK